MSKKLTHNEFMDRFIELGQDKYFEVLSRYTTSREKMTFKCKKCNHVFTCTANNMTKKENTYGCPNCAKDKRLNSEYLKKLTGNITKVENKIKELYPDGEYSLISTEYINNKTPLSVKCNNCGYEFKISYVNICKGKGCKYCNQPSKHNSKGTKKIRKYLEDNNYIFEEEYIIEECKNIKPLPFDFKVNIGDSFLLIEFDGEFHERNSMDSHALALQKKRDSIKNEYCKENNIYLLRINWREYNNINTILESYISNLSSTTIETTSSNDDGRE